MECLIDLIGLRDCSETPPTSGKYVNDLPSISTEFAQGISDDEQASFKGIWSNVQRLASERLHTDMITMSSRVAGFKGDIFRSDGLRVDRNSPIIVATPDYRGVAIQLPSNRGVSVEVKALQFISNTAISGVEIKAIDLIDNSEYFSITADVVQGRNSIAIEEQIKPLYENSRIFIGIDTESVELRRDKGYYHDDYYCDTCQDYSYDYFWYKSARLDKATMIESIESGSGVVALVNVACTMDDFICGNLSRISEAMRYLLGYMLIEEKQNSRNMNLFAYSNQEATEVLKASFAESYEREMVNFVATADFKSYCFTCDDYGKISTGYITP